MFALYQRVMSFLHLFCLWVASLCLLVITLIIPWGVYTRYVHGFGSQWPEPIAIMLMIVFTFFAGAVCYRENLHISVTALPSITNGISRKLLGLVVEGLTLIMTAFIFVKGSELSLEMMHQVMAQMPDIPVGVTYAPIPIGGGIMLLFVIERIWGGTFFEGLGGPVDETVSSD